MHIMWDAICGEAAIEMTFGFRIEVQVVAIDDAHTLLHGGIKRLKLHLGDAMCASVVTEGLLTSEESTSEDEVPAFLTGPGGSLKQTELSLQELLSSASLFIESDECKLVQCPTSELQRQLSSRAPRGRLLHTMRAAHH